jgi:hypothetical protein
MSAVFLHEEILIPAKQLAIRNVDTQQKAIDGFITSVSYGTTLPKIHFSSFAPESVSGLVPASPLIPLGSPK